MSKNNNVEEGEINSAMEQEEMTDKNVMDTEQKTDSEERMPKKKSRLRRQSKEDKLTEELNESNEKLAEINDKYLRLYSEFDNFRKRTIKEKSELYKTAGQDVIISIISIVDDFERALKVTDNSEESKAHREGIELIYNKFNKILEQKGVKAMDATGTVFDTDLHEAITKIPAPTPDLKGKVVDVIEKGYTMNDKVIRFAKVVVGD